MAERHIRRLFAFAGQRFADSHEFHIDRARWDVADIKFFPNSRFGVGVLSYFMLAEELDIASRRWAPPADLPPPSVHARIIGSGSLFRLDTVIDPRRLTDDYGTSVRLYMREDSPENDYLIKSILNWLFIPEVAVTISPEAGDVIELMPGKPTDRFRVLANDVLLPVRGSESTTGSTRVYIAPRLDQSEIAGLSDNRDNHRANFALVDGIFTTLAGEPWPDCLVVNLTEELRAKLTVDRRQVDPPAATVKPVLDWTRENGGAALASWSAPEFFRLHAILMELDPKVTKSADAILRETVRPDMMMTVPYLQADWPLSVGLSDLDPDIVLDLFLAVPGATSRQAEYMLRHQDYELGLYHYRRMLKGPPGLTLRAPHDSSIDPVVIQGLFHRAKELADAGLVFPSLLQHAILFQTRDISGTFPAAYRPAVAALDAQRQVGLAARWTSGNKSPVADEEDVWNDETLSHLDKMQKILISRDLDGERPFLTNIRVGHFLKFSRRRDIKSPSQAVKLVRSLADLGRVDLTQVQSLDEGAIAGMAEVPITGNGWTFVERLFHACRHHRPASVWDLALGATAAKIEPARLGPVLDFLEAHGGDVARCREFLASCVKRTVHRVRRRRSRDGGQKSKRVEAP
jgi:hypothetical protein